MALPLLTRATPDGLTFALTRRTVSTSPALLDRAPAAPPPASDASPLAAGAQRMPTRVPGPGEQYRFHFDMKKCIGCKCCVVACNEQNGNPASINWRRVGDIEGGFFPNATRAYLSMGCNHCLEPTCLSGCPVDAYTKDAATGIVRHSADACIGCQYCTWNCSYGVPQYNPERGVVGKCDMCHGRLSLGQSPACVSACPEGAIQIEIVRIDEWRQACAAPALAPGLPAEDHSLSTTRITVPAALPPNTRPLDLTHVAPEHPHWSLIVMTVLTQLSAGALAIIWVTQLLGVTTRLGIAVLSSLLVGGLALNAATLHLGRPVHAYRALRMWRRSWLSREVALFAAFSAVAGLYAGALWFGLPGSAVLGGLTTILGLAGVTASACIYRVPSRPAWNTPLTLVQFNLTAGLLGLLFAASVGIGDGGVLAIAAATMAGAQLLLIAARFFRLIAADSIELRGTARLLSSVLASRFLLRGALLVVGGALPLAVPQWMPLALVLALAGELLGRYLFFVSVVPKHMTTPYLAMGSEAA
jgi:Fe-S-cluster-containing dehydrogenase component/DMSO reductase anchor subunit